MTAISPGNFLARAEALEESVMLGEWKVFMSDLLDLCKEASEELRARQFKREALILHGEFTQLNSKARSRLISEDEFSSKARVCTTQGLELKDELIDAYKMRVDA